MTESSADARSPRQNRLIAALPEFEQERWCEHLKPVDLLLGQVLCEAESPPQYAYFPTTAIVSLLYLTRNGGSSEVAVIGNDGVVGISLLTSSGATLHRAVVQSAGRGYRLHAQTLRDEALRHGPMLEVLVRYALELQWQVAQTAACNRHHSIDQLLCRRLLLGLDRSASEDIVMTQELAASLLGVRRESVTTAANRLQRAGVISYSRGRIAVLDRRRLEERASERFAVATQP